MKTNKKLIRGGFLLTTIGLTGLLFPFISSGFFNEYGFLTEAAKNQSPQYDLWASTSSSISPTPRPDYEQKHVKNRLTIASVGIDMPIFEGGDASVLAKGGWIFPHTSTPDKGGNTVIFGHRFKYLPPISNTFYKLDKLFIGDRFTFMWQGVEYKYQVTETKIIKPTDLTVLNPTEQAQITLITCWPLFSTEERFVVIATRIE
jgi:sortase A